MKAAILTGYRKNGCDLVLRDVPVPEVSAQEVLVKVHTAGVNPRQHDHPRRSEDDCSVQVSPGHGK